MNAREYLRLRRQLDDDYEEKVRALDMVWEMACGEEPLPKRDDTQDNGGRVALASEIMKILDSMREVFSTKEVEEAIRRDRPDIEKMDRSTVSHTLKRAAREGKLEVVEPGKGKRPTKYRRLNPEHLPPTPETQTAEIRAKMTPEAFRRMLAARAARLATQRTQGE